MTTYRITDEQLDRMILLLERHNQLARQRCLDLGYTADELDAADQAATDNHIPLVEGGTVQLGGDTYKLLTVKDDGSAVLTRVTTSDPRRAPRQLGT